jgi:glutaredoxin
MNVIYTKDNCSFCVKAKSLMESKGEIYQEVKLGRDITREEFMTLYPEVKTVPFIIRNGENVYGYERLAESISGNGSKFLTEDNS